MARQLADGKPVKKVRPRRTVDYGGAMGRWILVSMPHIFGRVPAWLTACRAVAENAAKPDVCASAQARAAMDNRCRGGLLGMYGVQRLNISRVQLLPPKAYPNNPTTSLCTKFVHTSTNKIRCPVNCVVVSSPRNTLHKNLDAEALVVDTRSAANIDRLHKRRVHAVEWADVQLRDHPASPRLCCQDNAIHPLWSISCVRRPERCHQVLPTEHEQLNTMDRPQRSNPWVKFQSGRQQVCHRQL